MYHKKIAFMKNNIAPVNIHYRPKFDKKLIKVGNYVKVSIDNERMWAEIVKIEKDTVYAELRNDHTENSQYHWNAKVYFSKSQILDAEKP